MEKYKRSAVETIFGDHMGECASVDADGVRVSDELLVFELGGGLQWHPASELEGLPGAPDPLEEPNLPFDFSAAQLAAFMVDGIGALLVEIYGPWKTGPDEDELHSLGPNAGKAREALRGAYAAYRAAESSVGTLDLKQQVSSQILIGELADANLVANRFERLWESGISEQEKVIRRIRAKASVALRKKRADAVKAEAADAHAAWRQKMVRTLYSNFFDAHYPKMAPVDPRLEVGEATLSGETSAGWKPRKPQRFTGYTHPLYELLKAAHAAGRMRPSARDVLRAFEAEMPPELIKVGHDAFTYYDAHGNSKHASLNAITEAIRRHTIVGTHG